ncbi:MAG: rubredoxin, partial [Bacteroidota bacterium]|nr:rubredoxin [Bacteroidota bacterium]
MRQQFSRVIVKGGVVSPGELKIILDQAERLDLDTIAFGSRQDILFLTQNKIVDNSSSLRLVTPDGDRVENIMSSYVTSDLFAST